MGCEHCIGLDGELDYPMYGLAPGSTFVEQHPELGVCYGVRQPAPREEWPDNFIEDPDCPGMGVWLCPHCMGWDDDDPPPGASLPPLEQAA